MDRSEFMDKHMLDHIELCKYIGKHSVYELGDDRVSSRAIRNIGYTTVEELIEHGCSYKKDLINRPGIGRVTADRVARILLMSGVPVRDIPDREQHYITEYRELLIRMRYIDKHIGWLIDNTKGINSKFALLALAEANSNAYDSLVYGQRRLQDE